MKKLLSCILILVLTLTCLTACDLFKKAEGITYEEYENCAVFTFDNFPEGTKASFTLARTGLDEGAIHYQVNLEEGALSIQYKESGFIHKAQPLGEFTADDDIPINGAGGYVEGDKITITFESFSPVSGQIIIAFTTDALKDHLYYEHVYGEWHYDESQHWCECLCKGHILMGTHINNDSDSLCDVCGYQMPEPPTPTNYFLRNQAGCQWLNEITAEDIAEIKIISEAVGVAPGTPKNISSSTDKAVIARVFEEYYWLDTWPISKENGEIDGGGAVTAKFILKDGTEKQIYINNGNYCDTNGNYFDLLSTPNFKYGEDFTSYHGFVSYEGTALVNAYTHGAAEVLHTVCTIPMDELEFIPFEGSIGAAPTDYPYFVHTEFGDLVFHYNDLFSVAGTGQYYQLVGKNLEELICEYSYRMHDPRAEYVSIRKYYGRFASGALVAMIDSGDYPCVVWEETVGSTVITYGDGNRILVLYGGDFYTLPDAYTAGYLTTEDLDTIAKLHGEH